MGLPPADGRRHRSSEFMDKRDRIRRPNVGLVLGQRRRRCDAGPTLNNFSSISLVDSMACF